MGRILFWFLLGLAVYLAWRWWQVKQRLRDDNASAGGTPRITQEAMVPCDICGLNVPQSEAFAGNGRWYCSDEHRRRAPV